MQVLNHAYQSAAEAFSRQVVSYLGARVDSIVLYGSVARGQAGADSDIDLLVITPEGGDVGDALGELRSEFAYERDYSYFIALVHLSRQEFYELRDLGAPFLDEVLRDGVILYDNGTFSRVRQEAARVR